MGTFIKHLPCPECGSSDGNALYDDSSTFCHVCQTYGHSDGGSPLAGNRMDTEQSKDLLRGTFCDIPKRGLREETCRLFGYKVGDDCQIADYRDDTGSVVAQKVRKAGKDFHWTGKRGKAGLYGQHLWKPGKSIVITEGEIDCLSVSQAMNNKWPVVSLPDGAPSAKKAIERAFEYLSQFERIVLCFDQDEPGRKATQECAEILPVGKTFVMTLERKDANEVLLEDGSATITQAYWNAKEWRPDGIVSGTEFTVDQLMAAIPKGYTLPWPILTEKTGGIREGELTLLTAGSGIGKSTAAREIAYYLHENEGLTIGNIFLEEPTTKTAQAYVALDNNIRLASLRKDPHQLPVSKWEASVSKVLHSGRMFFYDHFGSLESQRLIAKIRYMRTVLGCNFVVLDHISIIISGQESSSEGERRDIDMLMTRLASLVEETGLGIVAIVHLKQPEGKPHEEGGRVTLSQLRGSGSLKQLSHNVWALERDQQGENPNQCDIRILKDREDGNVGLADNLEYNQQGRLVSIGGFIGM